jgi:hypothetical protein
MLSKLVRDTPNIGSKFAGVYRYSVAASARAAQPNESVSESQSGK